MKIGIAKAGDAARMLEIYAPFISDSSVSFEYDVPTAREFQKRVAHYTQTYPWLICNHGNEVLGYAYASSYRDRAAYKWSCECSVYIDERFQRRGIAKALYLALFDILRIQGFVNVYAVITHPNPASIKFHASLGFKKFAVYKRVGYKHGRWHDVHWLEKPLSAYPKKPKELLAFSKIKGTAIVNQIIQKHSRHLQPEQ